MLLNNRQLVSLLHPVGDSHEIIENLFHGLEETFKAHLAQALCNKQGCIQLDHVA